MKALENCIPLYKHKRLLMILRNRPRKWFRFLGQVGLSGHLVQIFGY